MCYFQENFWNKCSIIAKHQKVIISKKYQNHYNLPFAGWCKFDAMFWLIECFDTVDNRLLIALPLPLLLAIKFLWSMEEDCCWYPSIEDEVKFGCCWESILGWSIWCWFTDNIPLSGNATAFNGSMCIWCTGPAGPTPASNLLLQAAELLRLESWIFCDPCWTCRWCCFWWWWRSFWWEWWWFVDGVWVKAVTCPSAILITALWGPE